MVTSGFAGASAATIWSAANVLQLTSLQNSLAAEIPANAAKIFDTLDSFMRGEYFNISSSSPTVSTSRQLQSSNSSRD
jgi:hypothetical protein